MAPVQSAQSGDFSNGAELGTPTARLDRFLSEVYPPTPFIVHREIIAALAALGASFDLASPGELDI